MFCLLYCLKRNALGPQMICCLTSFFAVNNGLYCDVTVYFSFFHIVYNFFLSYDVAVIQWITSCHKNRMTSRVIILWHVHVTPLTTSRSALCFLIERMIENGNEIPF